VTIAEDERRRYEARFERHQRRAKRDAGVPPRRPPVKKPRVATRSRDAGRRRNDHRLGVVVPTRVRVEASFWTSSSSQATTTWRAAGGSTTTTSSRSCYPTRLFDDGPEDGGLRGGRDEPKDAEISRKMNKTSLVALWVDPVEHQIVKFTFDNVWLDFLPAAWLLRVDNLKASMVMGQPFKGVWLPRAMNIHAGVTLANGSYEVTCGREFSNTGRLTSRPPFDSETARPAMNALASESRWP
jgi:hypothetical protein